MREVVYRMGDGGDVYGICETDAGQVRAHHPYALDSSCSSHCLLSLRSLICITHIQTHTRLYGEATHGFANRTTDQ